MAADRRIREQLDTPPTLASNPPTPHPFSPTGHQPAFMPHPPGMHYKERDLRGGPRSG